MRVKSQNFMKIMISHVKKLKTEENYLFKKH